VEALSAVVLWVLLLVVPGTLVGLLLGLPRHVAVGIAAPITFGLVGGTTPLYGVLGIRWNPWTAGAMLLVALAVAGVVRRWVLPRFTRSGASPSGVPRSISPWWTLIGIGGAAVIATIVFLRGTGGIGAVSQYWDAVWHTNYTRWIAQTGQASPLRAGQFLNLETHAPTFYPSAMHAVGALVLTISGAQATVAVNAGILVSCALIIPVGAACLTWAASRGNVLATTFAALAASLFSALPYDQTWRPAWPFALVVGLSGAVVALLVSGELTAHPGRILAAACSIVGVVSIHPSAVLCVGIPVFGWLLVRLVVNRRDLGRQVLSLVVVAVLSGVALAVQLRQVFAVSGTLVATNYSTPFTIKGSLHQLALFNVGFAGQTGQWVLTVLAVLGGVVAVWRRQGAWLLPTGVIFALLGIQTMTGKLPVLHVLTSAFWNDYWRLGAMVAWIACSLVGIGLAEVVHWGARVPRVSVPVVGVLVGAVLLVITGGGYVGRNVTHMTIGYTPGVVGPEQLAAMNALPRLVPAGQVVLNDPMDGSAWMYSVAGVRPMFVHYQVGPLSADQVLLLHSLNQLDTNPAVQAAVRRLGLQYVYAGDRAIYPWTSRSPGFLNLSTVAALHPVFSDAGATVYRIDLPARAES
jgi:hypothetical protein